MSTAPLSMPCDGVRDFLGIAEARQRLDPHRPIREAVAEVGQVLLRQQGRGGEHRNLFAGFHRGKGRAHGHFGLAESHIAAHDPVHRPVALQVIQHGADRLGLVLRLIEREGVGELLVFLLAERQLQALLGLAARIQVEQLGGDIADLLGGALASRPRPLIGAQLVQRRALRAQRPYSG